MGEEVVLKETSRLRGAVLEGPTYDKFTDEAFSQVYERLEAWLSERGLTPTRWISHFYDAPEAEEGRSEACIVFEGEATPSKGIRVEALPAQLVASLTTTLDQVAKPETVYERMYGWIEEKGYEAAGPAFVREIYDVNPWKAPEEETQVEFQVPVREPD